MAIRAASSSICGTHVSAKSRAAAVMVHGGFWRAKYDLAHVSHLCAALAAAGFQTASLEYRKVGEPGGGWPGTYDDVVAGLKTASEHLASAPVILGHSAGGHLALRLACDKHPIGGVVALAPVAVLQLAYDLNLSNGAVAEFLGGTPKERPTIFEAACPSRHPSSYPRILLHGTNDDIVPISISRAFVSSRHGDSGAVTLTELKTADHFDLINPQSTAWPIVLESIGRLLHESTSGI